MGFRASNKITGCCLEEGFCEEMSFKMRLEKKNATRRKKGMRETGAAASTPDEINLRKKDLGNTASPRNKMAIASDEAEDAGRPG